MGPIRAEARREIRVEDRWDDRPKPHLIRRPGGAPILQRERPAIQNRVSRHSSRGASSRCVRSFTGPTQIANDRDTHRSVSAGDQRGQPREFSGRTIGRRHKPRKRIEVFLDSRTFLMLCRKRRLRLCFCRTHRPFPVFYWTTSCGEPSGQIPRIRPTRTDPPAQSDADVRPIFSVLVACPALGRRLPNGRPVVATTTSLRTRPAEVQPSCQ